MTLLEYIFAKKFDYSKFGLEDPVEVCKRNYPVGTKYHNIIDRDDMHEVVGYIEDNIEGDIVTLIVTKVFNKNKDRFTYNTDTANSFLYQQNFWILTNESHKVKPEIVNLFKKFKK